MSDEVAEWLRRWTANPLGSPRVGSNPILVENIFFFSPVRLLALLLQRQAVDLQLARGMPEFAESSQDLGYRRDTTAFLPGTIMAQSWMLGGQLKVLGQLETFHVTT